MKDLISLQQPQLWLQAETSSLDYTGLFLTTQMGVIDHRMVWVGRHSKYHLYSNPLPWAGTPRPGYSKPHPAWDEAHKKTSPNFMKILKAETKAYESGRGKILWECRSWDPGCYPCSALFFFFYSYMLRLSFSVSLFTTLGAKYFFLWRL